MRPVQASEPGDRDRRPFDLVVFDLDGTLIDSLQDLTDAANELVVHLGGRLTLAPEQVAMMVGEGVRLLVERVLAASGTIAEVDVALAQYLTIYNRRQLLHTKPYPGIVHLLQRAAPRMALAVLSNKPAAATRSILDALDLSRYFVMTLGGDGPFPRKPDPAALLYLMQQTATVSTRTLVVGDSLVDLETARAAGARFCRARYGFGRCRFPETALSADDWVVDTAGELRTLLDCGSGDRGEI